MKLMRSLREMNECLIEAAGGDQPQRAHRLRSKVNALKYQDPEAKLTDGKLVQVRARPMPLLVPLPLPLPLPVWLTLASVCAIGLNWL